MSIHDFTDIHNPPTSTDREIPHSIEAEQALLGAILLDNSILDRVADIVTGFDFYDPLHAQIFEITSKLIQANNLASPITLKTYFDGHAPITDDMTVPRYIVRLATRAGTTINAPHYARTVADLAARRKVIGVAQDMMDSAWDSPADTPASAVIERAERGLYEIAERATPGREMMFGRALKDAIATMAAAYQNGSKLSGIPTGLVDLDHKLGGLQSSDLIILGGRPAMGKSALAMTLAHNVAKSRTEPRFVHVFSLEMGASQLAMRQLSAEAEMASDKLRRGDFSEDEFREVARRADSMADLPILIDETGGIGIGALAAKARRIKRRHDTGLIVVDYLQLMSASNRRGDNRVQEITEITTGLKALAKELNVPVLALSQLSRKVEERADKRPQLADLRESGSIEQDADVVMFVYRDEYYIDRERPADEKHPNFNEWQSRLNNVHGKAEVILAKHRHGPVGSVTLAFESQFTRFANLAQENRR